MANQNLVSRPHLLTHLPPHYKLALGLYSFLQTKAVPSEHLSLVDFINRNLLFRECGSPNETQGMVCACPERDLARRALHRNQMWRRRSLPLQCLMMLSQARLA